MSLAVLMDIGLSLLFVPCGICVVFSVLVRFAFHLRHRTRQGQMCQNFDLASAILALSGLVLFFLDLIFTLVCLFVLWFNF